MTDEASSPSSANRRASWAARLRHPAALAAIVFAVAIAVVAWVFPPFHTQKFMWSEAFAPAVAVACGRGLTEIAEQPPELRSFLSRSSDNFDCANYPADAPTAALSPYASGIPYFLRTLGMYWGVVGVSWLALVPLMTALFALSAALAFLLFRLFFGVPNALVLTALYAVSPAHFFSLTYYEHYFKTPLVLATLVTLSWLVLRAHSARAVFAAARLLGVVVGFGYGVRADLYLLTLPAVAALLLFTRVADVRPWRVRGAAAAIFVALTSLLAAPAATGGGQSYFWQQLLQGLSAPFDADLRVAPSVYEIMPLYSDNMGVSWIESYDFYQRQHQAPDLIERFPDGGAPAPGALPWDQKDAAAREGYLSIMRQFPADFITRPLAATRAVIEGGVALQPRYATQIQGDGNFFQVTTDFWRALSNLALRGGLLIPLLVIGLFALWMRDWRSGLFLTLLVLFMGGATAIVFIPRHNWPKR